MEIPNDAIRRYADNIYWCCDESRNEATRQLLSWMAEHPGATIGQTRDYAIEMLGQVCGAYGDSSAAVAAEFFEAIVSAEGYDDLVATVYEGPDLDAIERGVRYQTGKLVNGDTDGFVDGVSEIAWYHTKRAANQTSYQSAMSRLMSSDYFETTSKAKRREAYNAGRRNKSRIRYARVPTGIETCTYCVMLASRGFVYRDEEVAGHGDHRGCDCLIVPGVAGSTTIEGYDREQMLELYSRYDQIDHEAPLDDDGNLLTGKAAEEWRDARKREAMRDVIGREQWSVGSGEVRKTESGHVWQRGRRVQGLEGLDRVELGRRYAEIDRTTYYDSAGRPLRGSALERRRRSEKIAAEQRLLLETDKPEKVPMGTIATSGGRQNPVSVESANLHVIFSDDDLRRRVVSDDQPLTIQRGKQSAHIPGTNEYRQAVSTRPNIGTFDIDGTDQLAVDEHLAELQRFVNEMHGSGELHSGSISGDGYVQIRETVLDENGIITARATWRSGDGLREEETRRYTIHYSKSGTHVVPSNPNPA